MPGIEGTVIVNEKNKELPFKLEEEEPLILEQVHEEKVTKKQETQISPAARKMANEKNVNLQKVWSHDCGV